MEKIRNSAILKILSYIMIPVLVAILGLSLFHMAYISQFNKEDETKYYQTEKFSNEYINFLRNEIIRWENKDINSYFIPLEREGITYYYTEQNDNYYFDRFKSNIYYVIVDKETGKIFTNVRNENYQDLMKNINKQNIYWNRVDEKIDTNLKYINEENIVYHFYNTDFNSQQKQEYDIYSFYEGENTNLIADFFMQHKILPIYTASTSIILLLIIVSYLFWAIGYKKGKKGIQLNTLDKIPYEIICIVGFNILLLGLLILANFYTVLTNSIYIFILIFGYIIAYLPCCLWGITTIKRIKAGTFWKSFLTYKIAKWIYNKVKKIGNELENRTDNSRKFFWYYWGFIIISLILGCFFSTGTAILVLIIFWIWTFYKIRKNILKQEKIKQALKQIYEGKTDIKLDEEELKGVLKEMAHYVNDIAGGFSNAIKENLKSERLKTELITNVSHDIKTPLTSIINYVDLLKKEIEEKEKVKNTSPNITLMQEYIEVLDRKSQRLKKLIEDLVEASKASSGNLKLHIEEINLKELIHQSIGEFKDKFEAKQLKIEVNMPNEEIKIKADSRYLYRVIENLFSNISKYALDNSRVYIDVKKENNKIEMSIKNISKDKLNISSDELMQRFVRGDKARYTEGSGLGLSIAKSLVELQGGKFNIIIDGDLFKAVMIW